MPTFVYHIRQQPITHSTSKLTVCGAAPTVYDATHKRTREHMTPVTTDTEGRWLPCPLCLRKKFKGPKQ